MFKLTVPDFLSALNCDKYAKEGTQLIEGDKYPFFMSEEAFVCMRMVMGVGDWCLVLMLMLMVMVT